MSKTWSLFLYSIPWCHLLPHLSLQSSPGSGVQRATLPGTHLPAAGTEPPTSPRFQTNQSPLSWEAGRQRHGSGGSGTDASSSLSSWQDTWGLLSGDQDPLLGLWQMRVLTILFHPTVAWVRRRDQAGWHSMMTMLIAPLKITCIKLHAMQLILHELSTNGIRPQTSQQSPRLSSTSSAALCPGLVAVGQDPLTLPLLNSSHGLWGPSSSHTTARFSPWPLATTQCALVEDEASREDFGGPRAGSGSL